MKGGIVVIYVVKQLLNAVIRKDVFSVIIYVVMLKNLMILPVCFVAAAKNVVNIMKKILKKIKNFFVIAIKLKGNPFGAINFL